MVTFLFKAFHKSCFKCGDCTKGLDSVNVTEGPDKEIYCKGMFFVIYLLLAWPMVTFKDEKSTVFTRIGTFKIAINIESVLVIYFQM